MSNDKNRPPRMVSKAIICSCKGVNHIMQLNYLPAWPEKNDPFPMLSMEMVMPYPVPLFKRIWLALKYIFMNDDCTYLGFDHYYDVTGAKEHIAILQRFVDEWPYELDHEFGFERPNKTDGIDNEYW